MSALFERDQCRCGRRASEGTPCHRTCPHCQEPVRVQRWDVHQERCGDVNNLRHRAHVLFQKAYAERLLAGLARTSPF